MAVTVGSEISAFSSEGVDATGIVTGLEDVSFSDPGIDLTPTSVFAGEPSSYPTQGVDVTTTKVSREITKFVITSLSQAAQEYVVNKVWDTVAGAPVRWATEQIDYSGDEYPGPGVFGVQTSHYRIETVMFTRV